MAIQLGVRGGLSVDHLVVTGEGAQFDQLGGPGLYGLLGGRLVDGVAVRLSANLPADEPRFAGLFSRLNVDDRFCASARIATRVWILNSREGRRIVETAAPDDVEIEMAHTKTTTEVEQPAQSGFFTDLDGLLDSSPLTRPRAEARTVVGIDPHQVPMHSHGTEYLRRVTVPGGVVLPSRVQLSLIDRDVREATRRIASELRTPVVARLDHEGMWIVDGVNEWAVKDRDVTVRETTGAGDSSAAAIVAALAVGADIVTAAMFGVSIARIALSGWGPSALLDAEPLTAPLNGVYSNQER